MRHRPQLHRDEVEMESSDSVEIQNADGSSTEFTGASTQEGGRAAVGGVGASRATEREPRRRRQGQMRRGFAFPSSSLPRTVDGVKWR